MTPRARKPVPLHRAIRPAAGMTLVEVAVALALLVVILAGLFATLGSARRAEVWSHEHQAASEAAMAQLDLLQSNPDFDSIAALSSAFHVPYDTGNGQVNLTPALATFFDPGTDDPAMAGHIRTVRNPDGEAPPSDDLVEIRITAAWRSHDGANQRLDVVSRRAR